jgi:AraC-like DNA-binding protein
MKKHLIALQVYSVRDVAEKDFAGTVRKVKEMGYDGVELAGTYGMTAVEIKKILDETGLELVSAHVPMNQLEDDAVLDDFAATGMKYIAIPWFDEPGNQEELAATVERIRKVIQYVESHYTEPVSLEDAAGLLGIGKEYFCRFFKKNMGISFLRYVNQVRASHIYQDLIHTDLAIAEIMEKNGFTNQKLSNRTFKELYGCTPSKIRKSIPPVATHFS